MQEFTELSVSGCASLHMPIIKEWVPIAYGSIGYEPFTALEQWKVPRHRSL